MRNETARRVALTGMLFALAMALSFFESLVTPFFGLPPGVKLGLANIVVMYALLFLSRRQALLLVALKAAFGLLTRGATAGFLSLLGGLCSFAVMALLMLPKKQPSLLVLSVAGSFMHNAGQMLGIRLLLGTAALYYAPVLIVSGIGMGVLTAVLLRVLMPALEKTGLHPAVQRKTSQPDGGVPNEYP